jgi:UDP-2,3-diacylglucosamine hydrolase
MPGQGLAIVAGRGDLPRLIAEDCARRRRTYRVVAFDGVPLDWTEGHPVLRAAFERPGRLFADLHAAGCGVVTFAGGLARPALRLLRFDLTMLRLAPRLIRGIRSGDDATLRLVAAIFEAEGFEVRAPHEILTDLVAPAGVLGRVAPGAADRGDAARAAAIVAALGAVDVGQGAVVARGICLGLESIQGTDALLDFVARTPANLRPARGRGVLFKAPKPGQDRRMDLPAIGPGTLHAAAAAGLGGVAIEAGGVMILGCAEAVAAADAAGLFLWARPPETQEGTATDFFARGGGL